MTAAAAVVVVAVRKHPHNHFQVLQMCSYCQESMNTSS